MAVRQVRLAIAVGALLFTVAAPTQSDDTRKPAGLAISTTMPGTAYGLDEGGRLDPGGVQQLNIPVGYTLSGDQALLTGWAGRPGGVGVNVQGGLSVGVLSPGEGLSLTAAVTDSRKKWTGHVQKQLWSETDWFPALSAGVLDVADFYGRSYYVTATKRLSGSCPKRPVVTATSPVWPPGPVPPRDSSPATWGSLRLSSRPLRTVSQPQEPTRMVAPFSKYPPVLDGAIGSDWEDATQAEVRLPDSELLLVRAKHNSSLLYVAVAVPSDHGVTAGARAELWFEAPRSGAESLPNTARKFVVQWGRKKNRLELLEGRVAAGKWRVQGTAPDAERPPRRFTGAVSAGGDQGESYPAFEFAVPLKDIGAEVDGPDLGFAVVVALPGGQPDLRAGKLETTERLCWPTGSARASSAQITILSTRPDLWGDLALEGKVRGAGRIGAPRVEAAPTIDGVMAEGEWDGADTRRVTLPTGAEQTLHVLRTTDTVFLALLCNTASGTATKRSVRVFIDPDGDEGLLPRPDDRCLEITVQENSLRTRAFAWNEKERKWNTPVDIPFEAVSASDPVDGSRHVTEISIPLRVVQGKPPKGRLQAVGLAVDTELISPPLRVTRQGQAVESGSGKSTFVTVGWGSGVYRDKVFGGVSQPVGQYRVMAEWDGDQVNVGLAGAPFRSEKCRVTVGLNGVDRGVDGSKDNGWVVGVGFALDL